jgi:hypothetical protein
MTPPSAFYQEGEIELEERAQALRNGAEDLLSVLRQKFGEADVRTIRAGEICDALQQLRWELERHGSASAA